MKNDSENNKVFARLLNEDFNNLNLKNNKYFETDYIMRCVEGDYDGKQVRIAEFGDEFLMGSDEKCNFTIKDEEISPTHLKMTYVKDTIYYLLEDLKSTSGTWKRISFFDDGLEVTETTYFKVFQNAFTIEKTEKGEFILTFTEGSLAGMTKLIEDDSFEIGKKECYYEVTMQCSENHILKVQKINNKIFVTYMTSDITNEGFFYKINPVQKVLIRADDCIRIGGNTFRFLIHNWGVTSEIGDKYNQEDTFIIIDDLKLFDDIVVPFYAVYDGHGGISCSFFLKTQFHKNLRFLIKMKNFKDSDNFFNEFCKTIQEAIIYTDLAFCEKEKIFSLHQGSTCICLFFIGNKVISCNLGDSLSILVKNNGDQIYLSRDLKPTREKERDRILKKNGIITSDGRMLGMISVSRAFGDWKLKDPKKADSIKRMFTCEIEEYLMGNRAEFRIYEINQTLDDYIILASDGIFQHHNPGTIFEGITRYFKQENIETTTVKDIPGVVDNLRLELINNLYGDNSVEKKNVDNMTLIVVYLQNNKI